MISTTVGRVREHTSEEINEQIRRQTDKNVATALRPVPP